MSLMYEVYITLRHSSLHAAVLLSTVNYESLSERTGSRASFRLSDALDGNVTIQDIRRLLEKDHELRFSEHACITLGFLQKRGPGIQALAPEATIAEAWATQADPEAGILELELLTEAAVLECIVSLEESADKVYSARHGMIDCFLDWRHFDGVLNCLELRSEEVLEVARPAAFTEKTTEYEASEVSRAHGLISMFAAWASLINGGQGYRDVDFAAPREQRRQLMEKAFHDWLLESKEVIDVASAAYLAQKQHARDTIVLSTTEEVIADVEASSNTSEGSDALHVPLESRLTFDYPPPDPSFSSRPLQRLSNSSSPHGHFTISSGILLWGQLHTVFAGSINTEFDTNAATSPPSLEGGTIRQHVMRYRAAARNGSWKIRRALSVPHPGNDNEATKHFGWVVCHADIDAKQLLDRCSRISPGSTAISNGNDHVDQDVLYINRYDWSQHCDPGTTNPSFTPSYQTFIQTTTGAQLTNAEDLLPSEEQELPLLSTRKRGFMLAVDAAHFGQGFMYNFMHDCHPAVEGGERVFCASDSVGEAGGYGGYVCLGENEYDTAWLVFSGKKHVDFPEGDELVGIIYDAAYTALDSHTFAVEELF